MPLAIGWARAVLARAQVQFQLDSEPVALSDRAEWRKFRESQLFVRPIGPPACCAICESPLYVWGSGCMSPAEGDGENAFP